MFFGLSLIVPKDQINVLRHFCVLIAVMFTSVFQMSFLYIESFIELQCCTCVQARLPTQRSWPGDVDVCVCVGVRTRASLCVSAAPKCLKGGKQIRSKD